MLGIRPVLVVDDYAEIREFVKLALRDQGYVVHTAEHAPAALERIDLEAFAVILLDGQMPVKDGTEFVREYRSIPGHQPHVVVMTAEDNAQQYAEQIQADAYVSQPLDVDQIVAAVSLIIQKSGRP
jgi:CheY-like chemotaxis protein